MKFQTRVILLFIFSQSSFGLNNNFQVSNFTDRVPDQNATVTCDDHLYIDKVDMRDVLRKWYALEIYMHLSNEGQNQYKSCPVTAIWEVDDFPMTTYGPSTENQPFHVQHLNAKFRQEFRHLRLLWDEAGYTNEYALYFRNDSVGYWQVIGRQNGSIPDRQSYQQFSGTVQVLKAVNDHLLLNFCQEAKQGSPAQLYSVLFSRDPGVLSRWELESVHNILQTKKLSIASRRMVCGNSAAGRPFYSLILSFFLLAISYAASSS